MTRVSGDDCEPCAASRGSRGLGTVSEAGEPDSGDVVLYQSPDGEVRLDVRLEHDTIWLTQKQMAELFDTSTDNVGLHLKNVYAEGELEESATTEESSVVRTEGDRQVRRLIRHYNLDAVISVGYRVDDNRLGACADSRPSSGAPGRGAGLRAVRQRARRTARRHPRRDRADVRWPAPVSIGTVAGRPSPLLRDQGSSVCGRQQAHRGHAHPPVPPSAAPTSAGARLFSGSPEHVGFAFPASPNCRRERLPGGPIVGLVPATP